MPIDNISIEEPTSGVVTGVLGPFGSPPPVGSGIGAMFGALIGGLTGAMGPSETFGSPALLGSVVGPALDPNQAPGIPTISLGFTVITPLESPWSAALPWNLMGAPKDMLTDTKKADAANSLKKPIDRALFTTG